MTSNSFLRCQSLIARIRVLKTVVRSFSIRHLLLLFLLAALSCSDRPTSFAGAVDNGQSPVLEPPALQKTGRIVYVFHQQDGLYQLRMLQLEDMSTVALTEPEFRVSSPVWRPDGRAIAFVSWERLPGSERSTSTIRLLDLDSGTLRTLLGPMTALHTPAWSPDGGRMAFIQEADIHVGQIDRLAQAVTITDDGNASMDGYSSRYTSLDWSPDGTRLLTSQWDQMLTMAPDGSERTPVLDAHALRNPLWNHDGTSIAYWTGWVMIWQAGDRLRVPFDSAFADDSSWSPDGNWVLFVSRYVGEDGLHAISTNGDVTHRLTNGGGASQPRWH